MDSLNYKSPVGEPVVLLYYPGSPMESVSPPGEALNKSSLGALLFNRDDRKARATRAGWVTMPGNATPSRLGHRPRARKTGSGSGGTRGPATRLLGHLYPVASSHLPSEYCLPCAVASFASLPFFRASLPPKPSRQWRFISSLCKL